MDLNAIARAIQKTLWTKEDLSNYKIGIKAIEKAVEKALQEIEQDHRSEELEERNLKLDENTVDKIAEKTAENISKSLKYGLDLDNLDTEDYISSPKLQNVSGVSHSLTTNLLPTLDVEANNGDLCSIGLSKKSKKKLFFRITSEEDIKKLDIMDFSLITLFGSLWENNPHKKTYTLQEIAKELIPLDANVKIRSEEFYEGIVQSCRRLNLTECYLNFEEDKKTLAEIEKDGRIIDGKVITSVRGSLFSNKILGLRLPNGEKSLGISLIDRSEFYYYLSKAKAIRSYPKSLFTVSSQNKITINFITVYLFLRYKVIDFGSRLESKNLNETDYRISINEVYKLFENEGDKLTNAKKQRIRKIVEKILNEWTETGLLIKWEALRKGNAINQYKIYGEKKEDFKELKNNAKRYQEINNVTKIGNYR